MFGDNEVVVNSSSNLHAKLHKRHNALSFHHVCEAIASKFIDFNYLQEVLPILFNSSYFLLVHCGDGMSCY